MAQIEDTRTAKTVPPVTGWRKLVCDLGALLRFLSRLPVPEPRFDPAPHAPPDFQRAALLVPVAGLIIALPAALVLWCAVRIGLPPLVAATCGVAMLAIVTAGLHEDGLADSFDGLAGGGSRERRLAIMKDSRIGAHGATALMLALILRVGALSALPEASGAGALASAAGLLAAAVFSRTAMLLPLTILPPARNDGASAAVGRPTPSAMLLACTFALGIASAVGVTGGIGVVPTLAAGLGGLCLVLAMTAWAKRALGGHTGDIVGACQQLAEVGFYLGLLVMLNGVGLR